MEEIITNPESYAKNADITELMKLLRYANDMYHDETKEEIIDDDTYDIIYDIAKKRVPANPFFKQIGIDHNSLLSLVPLPYHMSSMDKFKLNQNKDDDKILLSLAKWLDNLSSKSEYVCISDKLDGLSGLLIYDSKTSQPQLYTRGNEKGGKNVSHLTQYLSLPDQTDIINNKTKINKLAVRGEFIITKSKFESKYKDKYPKARSLIFGAITAKPDSNTFKSSIIHRLKDIVFITYEIVDIQFTGEKVSQDHKQYQLNLGQQLQLLKKLNFNIVWHTIIKTLKLFSSTAKPLKDLLDDRKQNSPYEIDGIIIHTNSVYERVKKGNPKYAVAFKINYSKTAVIAKVIQVEWNPSKHGKLTPRVLVEPVKVGGDKVSKVAGHNAKYIVDNNIGPGTEIKLIKSGDVIPFILDVVKSTKAQLPDKSLNYKWNSSKIDFILDNDDNELNDDVEIRKLHHLITTLDIPFINTGVIVKLYSAGYNTPKKLLKITKSELLQIDGIKEKSAVKFHTAIHSVIDKPIPLEILMTASNVFGKGFGKRKIKPVVKKYSNLFELYSSGKKLTRDNLLEVEGYSYVSADAFLKGMPKFMKFMKNNPYFKIEKQKSSLSSTSKSTSTKSSKSSSLTKSTPLSSNNFEGKKVVFTGFRDKILEEKIVNLGGSVSSSVSKNTNYLVVKDEETRGAKYDKAVELNVKIITLAKFKKIIS